MKRAGRILIWIVVAIAVLLVAVVLFVALFNWNQARPWLDQRLSTSIGRRVAINGDLTVNWMCNPDASGVSRWVPWPRFTAQDISIANPSWAQQPRFATLQQVRFSLNPLALLSHTIAIPSLKLYGPAVDVERDKQGRDNWTFKFAQGGGNWKLDIGEVDFNAGSIHWNDDKLDMHLDVDVKPLGKPIPFDQIVPASGSAQTTPSPHSNQAYYFAWTAKGTWRDAQARGSGKTGSVLALSDASTPFPLQADLRLRDLHIKLAGTLSDPVHLGALDLNLAISGDSMAHLYALTGVTLPATASFATHGRLLARIHQGVFQYEKFDGKVGHTDLHGSVGSIDLKDETLDLVMHPHSKGIRFLSLRSPFYLRGNLKHPDAGVEKGPLLARGVGAAVLGVVAAPAAALAALVAPSHENENACTDVLTGMHKPAMAHRLFSGNRSGG